MDGFSCLQAPLGYCDIAMKDTVMQGRIVDCYSLMGSKEGQVKIETQWFPQAKKDKSAASDEKADAIASVGSS